MSVGFVLRGIRTEQFATFSENLNLQQDAQVAHYFNFMLNAQIQQIGLFATFEFKQNNFVIMKIVVSCHFGIEPKAWSSFIEGDMVVFPRDFATNLAMITVGAARGILATKTEQTHFSKFLLPLLDITNIITSNISFAF
jgi:hypothetical protein